MNRRYIMICTTSQAKRLLDTIAFFTREKKIIIIEKALKEYAVRRKIDISKLQEIDV